MFPYSPDIQDVPLREQMCFLLGNLHQGAWVCSQDTKTGRRSWRISRCALGQGQLLFPHSWEKPDLVLTIETPHAACCSALVSVQSELFPGKLSSLLPETQRTQCPIPRDTENNALFLHAAWQDSYFPLSWFLYLKGALSALRSLFWDHS